MIGTQLAHYEVVRKLGSGGMGEVRRYLSYWNDGEIDRHEVAAARAYLSP